MARIWGRSCFGTPIISAMTSTGSGVARSRIMSKSPFFSASSRSSLMAFWTRGRHSSMDLGVK